MSAVAIVEWPMVASGDPYTPAETEGFLFERLVDNPATDDGDTAVAATEAIEAFIDEKTPTLLRYTTVHGNEVVLAAAGTPGFVCLSLLIDLNLAVGKKL